MAETTGDREALREAIAETICDTYVERPDDGLLIADALLSGPLAGVLDQTKQDPISKAIIADAAREIDALRAENKRLTGRLSKIAEWHRLDVDQHGGNTGSCAECGRSWPCPTYRTARDECTWDLAVEEARIELRRQAAVIHRTVREARRYARRRLNADHLAEVARVHAADSTGAPVRAVAEHFDVARRTAMLYVKLAREAGLIQDSAKSTSTPPPCGVSRDG